MILEWGEKKRLNNLRKHRLDFADAEIVFGGPLVTRLDVRFDYGEPRFIAHGLLQGRAVAVAYLEKPDGNIRIISMRKASRHEETFYFEAFKDRLESP